MITGLGTDIIEIERIRKAITSVRGFEERVFTPAERSYCRAAANFAERFAGRFAAKEAVAKAIGRSLSWQDVEVLPDEHGRPVVTLSEKAAEIAGGRSVLVSISHCREYAVAYAVLMGAES
jgi:holo-[acyl-carrier protein] synthase